MKAKSYLETACADGHAPACHNLAVMFRKGDDGVPKAAPIRSSTSADACHAVASFCRTRTRALVEAAGAARGVRVARSDCPRSRPLFSLQSTRATPVSVLRLLSTSDACLLAMLQTASSVFGGQARTSAPAHRPGGARARWTAPIRPIVSARTEADKRDRTRARRCTLSDR